MFCEQPGRGGGGGRVTPNLEAAIERHVREAPTLYMKRNIQYAATNTYQARTVLLMCRLYMIRTRHFRRRAQSLDRCSNPVSVSLYRTRYYYKAAAICVRRRTLIYMMASWEKLHYGKKKKSYLQRKYGRTYGRTVRNTLS